MCSCQKTGMDVTSLVEGVAAIAGSAVIGSYALGVPIMDLATSISGAAGAGLGYTAGKFAQSSLGEDSVFAKVAPVAGAILVPAVASQTFDSSVVILGLGAVAGAYVGMMVYAMVAPTTTTA